MSWDYINGGGDRRSVCMVIQTGEQVNQSLSPFLTRIQTITSPHKAITSPHKVYTLHIAALKFMAYGH